MSTTDTTSKYHKPLVKGYIKYVYPQFTKTQLKAVEELAEVGGFDLSSLHELAVAKFLGGKRKSCQGYDVIVNGSEGGIEAKYRRLQEVTIKGRQYYKVYVQAKYLLCKTAKHVWLTVYNTITNSEDHFKIPLKGRSSLSICFTYNPEKDSYNQGDRYLVHRGSFAHGDANRKG